MLARPEDLNRESLKRTLSERNIEFPDNAKTKTLQNLLQIALDSEAENANEVEDEPEDSDSEDVEEVVQPPKKITKALLADRFSKYANDNQNWKNSVNMELGFLRNRAPEASPKKSLWELPVDVYKPMDDMGSNPGIKLWYDRAMNMGKELVTIAKNVRSDPVTVRSLENLKNFVDTQAAEVLAEFRSIGGAERFRNQLMPDWIPDSMKSSFKAATKKGKTGGLGIPVGSKPERDAGFKGFCDGCGGYGHTKRNCRQKQGREGKFKRPLNSSSSSSSKSD
jgi:hypothetical protein